MASRQPPPPRLRLNSGSGGDLLDSDSTSSGEIHGRLPTSRSLTGQRGRGLNPRSASAQGQFAHQLAASESSERLLPPSRSRTRRFRDEPSSRSTSANGFDSRRTSWSSDSGDSRAGPFASPFDDSRAPSRAGSDEDLNTQTVSEKYNILPSAGLLLFPEDVEKDDYLHNPSPNDREEGKCADLFSKRGLVNLGGLILIGLGIGMLFIGYPVLTFVKDAVAPKGAEAACAIDPLCIGHNFPLLSNVRAGPIDPNTPQSAMTKKSQTGKTMSLVFSEEFEEDGRTFYPGDDPYFTGVNIWYGATMDLEWYDPDALETSGGVLEITFDEFPNHGLNYRSGMLQSWNQLCFKGGRMEASISLPGKGEIVGFWPGFWALGNLARPGYLATTDGMWPYSYDDVCDAGITANQSDPDGLNNLPGMRLPACTCDGEDHPSPGKSRSAPEIDAIEATNAPVGDFGVVGHASQSFQVAPFDRFWRPNTEFQTINDHSITTLNSYQGGVFQQALSGMTNLNNNWYNGKQYQSYSFEYTPGATGYTTFFVGESPTWTVDARSLGPNGNVGQRIMPEEPLALVSNFGMAPGFSAIDFAGIKTTLPAKMRFDYIRIYQDGDGELTCDPVGYPTTDYIARHRKPYDNPNITHWTDAGFKKPKNAFIDNCVSSAEPAASKERRGLFNCRNGRCNS